MYRSERRTTRLIPGVQGSGVKLRKSENGEHVYRFCRMTGCDLLHSILNVLELDTQVDEVVVGDDGDERRGGR